MSSSQSRTWQQTLQELQKRFQYQVSQSPQITFQPQIGKIIGVKAGLSLVALSPEPTPPTIKLGQECYNSSGTKIIGTLAPTLGLRVGYNTINCQLSTGASFSAAFVKVIRYSGEHKTGTVTIAFRASSNPVTMNCIITEDDVEKVASFGIAFGYADYDKSFVTAKTNSEIAIELQGSDANARLEGLVPKAGDGNIISIA